MPIFALIDANNFYASCERVFNPALEGKPVVILSNNDGCIISRSNEAKKLGVKMGEPYFKNKDFFRDNKVHVFSYNYALYGDMSDRVMKSLKMLVPEVEVYSVDEAFVKFDRFKHFDLKKYAFKIKSLIKLWTGIPVSIGIGPSKTLAKVANFHAKRINDIVDLCDETLRDEILTNLPVSEIWGIGRQLTIALNKMNVFTAKELIEIELKLIRKKFGVVGERTVLELRGQACYELEENIKPKKNIISSKSFGRTVTCLNELKEAVSTYLVRGCEKMRKQDSRAFAINVFICTSRFKKGDEYYSNSKIYKFSKPTNDTRLLIKHSLKLLDSIYIEGFKYNKAGIMLMDLVQNDYNQCDLFEESDYLKSDLLMKTLDEINIKEGKNTVFFASQGTKRHWRMKTNHKSPCYTTKWLELPLVF